MKIFVVNAEHFSNPSGVTKAYADKAQADAQAKRLAVLLASDNFYNEAWPDDLIEATDTGDWRKILRSVQAHRVAADHGVALEEVTEENFDLAEAAECDVWIEELELEMAIPPMMILDSEAGTVATMAPPVPLATIEAYRALADEVAEMLAEEAGDFLSTIAAAMDKVRALDPQSESKAQAETMAEDDDLPPSIDARIPPVAG